MKLSWKKTSWPIYLFVITVLGGVILSQLGQARASGNYPIVDTNQTTCYDSNGIVTTCPSSGETLYGQDANYTGNTPSYTNNGDGTITDNVTGLMWEKSPDTTGDGIVDPTSDKLSYTEAQTYCENLTLAGYTDWQLPDIKQLFSLIDFSGEDISGYEESDTTGLVPFIDTDYFDFSYGDFDTQRLIDAQYATSTEYESTTINGAATLFGVNFADGRIKGYGLNFQTFFVMCVRGNSSYGQNDFVDNGNTITDNATGLMWDKNDSGQGLDWEEAIAWVQTKNNENYLGHSDWRLPNAKELHSIVDYTRSPDTTSSAAIDAQFNTTSITNEAGETDYPYFWSSTSHIKWTGKGSDAAYIAFGQAMGYMNNVWQDVHGAGAQRSEEKTGNPDDYPEGNGPQGDAVRVYNYVRLVRDTDESGTSNYEYHLPIILLNSAASDTTTATPTPTTEDYNLFSPLGDTTTYLIDEDGNSVYTWSSSYRPGNAVYLLEDGYLLRTGNTNSSTFNEGGTGGIVEKIASDSTVVWSYTYDTAQGRLHHDVEQLPDGNILMIAWELKTEAEALAAGRNPSLISDGELWPDMIIEVDPDTNTIVWEWHVWDHLVQDYDAGKANYGVVADHPELIDLNFPSSGMGAGGADWNHTNSVDYNAEFDQILLSVRGFSEIWVIDHSTTTAEAAGHTGGNSGKGGDLLYRWGNPQAYDSGDANDQQLFVQHDAQWIPSDYPGGDNILIFNNGTGRSGGNYSSVDEIVPPVDSSGNYTGYGPTAPTWSYVADTPTDFYGMNISGAQRLPDGNTLICEGPDGYFFEVTSAGETVWDYDHGDSAIFRVTRYQSDYAGLPTIN